MTSSFGITPQRQIRDLVATPEAPVALPKPVEPAQTPQRVGGQLIYGRQFQPDTATEQSLRSIENFLAKGGVYDQTQKGAFENYKAQKKQEALNLLSSESRAYQDSLDNAKETRILRDNNQEALARQNQLRNPWVNYFYYDTKATNAGRSVAVDLGMWGKQNADMLAELPEDDRAAAIAVKTKELLNPYADIPSAFVSAKIDPQISNVLVDIKKDVIQKAYQRKVLTDSQTAVDKFYGGLNLGASLIKGSVGSAQGMLLGQQQVQQGYNEAYNYFVNVRGYTEKQFHEVLSSELGRLFIDNDKDSYNDIGEAYGFVNMVRSLGQIKTKDGISLTDLRNSKGQTFRDILEAGATQALKRSETYQAALERNIQRKKREYFKALTTDSVTFYANNPTPTEAQITEQRTFAKAGNLEAASLGLLPEGVSLAEANEQIDKLYPYQTKELGPTDQALLEAEIQDRINNGETELPADLRDRLEGTTLLGKAITEFANAARQASSVDFQAPKNQILKDLVNGLKGNFQQDPEYAKASGLKGQPKEIAKDSLNTAVTQASPRLRAEASAYVNEQLRQAERAGKDISDPNVQFEILQRAQSVFYARPEYNDVDAYSNVTTGQPATGPALGNDNAAQGGGTTKPWKININDTDNRQAFASVASQKFGTNVGAMRNYLRNNFVLNQTEIGEVNAALQTGDPSKLSNSTRRSLTNLQRAFNNRITTEELVKLQTNRFYNRKTFPANFVQNARKLQESLRVASASSGTKPQNTAIIITNWHHGHSQNRAVDFVVERQNGQIANPIPAPFSGQVVEAGRQGGFGLAVVIRASAAGPGYQKGDLVRVAHLATLKVKAGDRINRGAVLGISGDGVGPSDSRPGRSGTGKGANGHVHIQLYRPGGADWAHQYSQEVQNTFVRRSYLPLFRESR